MPPLQRRYSVTGQTPPDDVGPMKAHSPKLHALDTTVPTTTCELCGGPSSSSTSSSAAAAGSPDAARAGRTMAHHTIVRTSSKRSATQLPSPNTPTSQDLRTKIARLGLEHHGLDSDVDIDDGCLTDPFPDESTDWMLASMDSSSTSAPSSPDSPPSSLSSDEAADSPFTRPQLPGPHDDEVDDDEMMVEDLALSPVPTADDYSPVTLMSLPPELRHEIYRNVPDLISPCPLIYCLSTFANKKQHPLASVSRLIRSESLAIFYSYNTWVIKLEFKMMYEAFQDWIIRLGDGAGSLRLVTVAVRGSLFKPMTSHASSINMNGQMVNLPGVPGLAPVEEYHPPDGDASFRIDLSEKYLGGKVEVERNDGTPEAGEKARVHLAKLVEGLWEKRRAGTLNGQDWVNMVDQFLAFTGWW
ncbi:hypothetical protein BS50DRAFT_503159 [Corynespora cassiicola Philippines]|uniref:F-box domain-containing protein n=1 Tax=Corynespora cassiicola Philippines TaxID=1448308 RepID=A0A2T2N9F6_CORCC|nr:hypothetical protein BS50DRAFT_503159 [Corynespora cassiicola Philippines]